MTLCAVALGWGRAEAQANGPTDPPVERGPERSTGGPSFLVIRYSSQASLTFYGGYQIGRAIGFAGFVQNPRTSYREALVGAATTVASRGQSLFVGLAAAHASDGWYSQLYLIPTITLGHFEVSATLEFYQPLEAGGAYQAYTTPLNAFVWVHPRVAAGVTYLLSAQVGIPDGHALGPSVRVSIPKGTIRFDWMRRVAVAPGEVRITLSTSY